MRIVEIIDRSEQGITRPFLCRGEDGKIYYVKGRHAGYRGLCCEWVASELARHWGLPVAPFAIVEVPGLLISGSLLAGALDLGSGPAFGSQQVPDASELRWHEIESEIIPVDLRARLLLFDWWVANPDRMLSETGGNPNLLWPAAQQQLHIIDHNLAFSPHMMPPSLIDFCSDHVFGADLLAEEALPLTDEATAHTGPLIVTAWALKEFWQENRAALEESWEELPLEWTEAAPDFTLEEVCALLDRVGSDDFWGVSAREESE
ncbi:MAG: hypothetical protein M3347_13360 [Armatimonadota bacterium]|nr:hypothetical protein [Armatimonadota bacterium]